MENILLLQLNRLGDLVQTVPLLQRLRAEKPGARITLACVQGVHTIIAECGYFDRLLPVPLKDVEALSDPDRRDAFPNQAPFSAYPEFRETYDLVVNLTNDFGSSVINEKVKSARKLGRIHTFAGELRLLGPWSKYLFAMVANRVDNLFNLVDIQMGIADLEPKPQPASLPVSDARRAEAKALLDSHGRRGGRRLIALQTGASQLHRAWSLENFAAISGRLIRDGNAEIVLVGDAGERPRAEALQSLVGLPVVDLVGRTSLSQLPAVMQACDLLVSNDTGTIHIAAAVGTRTLGLYFSTAYFSETAPYGPGHAVLQVEIPCAPCHASAICPVQRCRDYLTPDAVHDTVRWMLDAPSDQPSEPPAMRPNLSLYKSYFLGNGSLIFLPVHAAASSHYFAGMMGRMLWECALGFSRDPQLAGLWKLMRDDRDWESKRATMAASLETLAETFGKGVNLAGKLQAEFSGAAPERDRILLLNRQLSELGAAMAASSKEGGLFADFLKYEMMDMDYVAYPELADILAEKYRRLSDWTIQFQATLGRMSAS